MKGRLLIAPFLFYKFKSRLHLFGVNPWTILRKAQVEIMTYHYVALLATSLLIMSKVHFSNRSYKINEVLVPLGDIFFLLDGLSKGVS